MEQLNQITLPLGAHGEGWKQVLDLIQDISDNQNSDMQWVVDCCTITLYLEPDEAHEWGYSRYKWVSAQEDEAIEERRLKRHEGK